MKKKLRLPLWFFLLYAVLISWRVGYEDELDLYREFLDQSMQGVLLSAMDDAKSRPWTGHLYAMMLNRITRELAMLDTNVVDYGVMPGGPSVPGADK